MSGYIRIRNKEFDLLDKYCNIKVRPAQLPLVMSRIVRPWVTRGAAAWARDPKLIPKFEKIPEKELTTVEISEDHARWFKNTCSRMETKFDIRINPDEVATFLVGIFCKAYDLVERNKYKPTMINGGIKKF